MIIISSQYCETKNFEIINGSGTHWIVHHHVNNRTQEIRRLGEVSRSDLDETADLDKYGEYPTAAIF